MGPILKTVLFTIVVPGTVGVGVPYLLAGGHRPAWGVGLIPAGLGAAVYFWCAWDFARTGRGTPAPIDPPIHLVAHGLYRFVRNPMYIGVLLLLLGEILIYRSTAVLVYALAVWALFHLFVTLYEEPALTRKFGPAYRKYCAATPRWLPRPPRH